MSSKYVDVSANMQVIGDVFINPSLVVKNDKNIGKTASGLMMCTLNY